MQELQDQITLLLQEICTYNDKPTKSKSREIRMLLGQLKLDITGIRKELVEKDKAGY